MSEPGASDAQGGPGAASCSLTPHLWFDAQASAAIELYVEVFDARIEDLVQATPDGPVLHALVRIGGAALMLADAREGGREQGPREGPTAGLWLNTPDCEGLFARALAAGFESVYPPKDSFWGERIAKLVDPFGHPWSLATRTRELSPEQIQASEREFLAQARARVQDPGDS